MSFLPSFSRPLASKRAFAFAALLGHAALAKPTKPKHSRVLLSDEDPHIEYDPHFLTDTEVAAIRKMATDMGFHRSNNLETPQQVTFLPSTSEEADEPGAEHHGVSLFEYEADSGSVEFIPSEYSEKERFILREFEAKVAKWTKSKNGTQHPSERPLRVFAQATPVEDPHLDAHLNPHVHSTVLTFLDTDETSSLVFPCVETDDMTPEEWRKRQSMCRKSYSVLQAAHDKMVSKLEHGILHEDEASRLAYLHDNPDLTVLESTFKEDEESRQRSWNWLWEDSAEQNQAQFGSELYGLKTIVAALCGGKEDNFVPGVGNIGPVKGLKVPFKRGAAVKFLVAKEVRSAPMVERMAWHSVCIKKGKGEGKKPKLLLAERTKEVSRQVREKWSKAALKRESLAQKMKKKELLRKAKDEAEFDDLEEEKEDDDEEFEDADELFV